MPRSNSKVPYDLFEKALEMAREEYPNADDYRINWYGGNILVEVWNKGYARVTGPYDVE